MSTTKDLYDILGISKTATAAEIKSAYRKLALKWHPDKNKEAGATEKFKELSEAYEILSNPDKKSKYDQFGHAAFGGNGGNPYAGASGNPFSSYYSSGGNINLEDLFGGAGGFSDPFDVFSSFFGGASRGGQRRQAKTHYSLKLDFLDAVNGVEKTIIHQGKQYTIKVPAGIDEGNRISYNEFDVSFDIATSPIFKREGSDVIVNQDIPLTMAILGGEIEIPTLSGGLKVRIKPGTQPETVVRLTGKGIKHLQSNKHGDLYIRYLIKIPTKISSRQKELLKKFAED